MLSITPSDAMTSQVSQETLRCDASKKDAFIERFFLTNPSSWIRVNTMDISELDVSFGKKVKIARTIHEASIEELMDLTGYSLSYLTKMESSVIEVVPEVAMEKISECIKEAWNIKLN